MFLVISVNLYLTRGHYISVTNGQSRFFRFCPYLHYTGVFGHVNKTCLKQAVFTGCVRLDVLQNRFPAGNGSAPSPACVRSIFSWYPGLPDTAFSKGCHLTGKPSCLPDKIKSLYSGFIYNFTVFITVSYIFQTLPARNIEARLYL